MSSKPVSTRRRKTSGESHIRRKNLNIDQKKLDRIVEILGADSETAAIDQMMDEFLCRDDLSAGIRRIAGTGGVENYFPDNAFAAWEE
jgi:hypothetical protein